MLEIKCPFVREITNKGAIAGDICPYYYYCQVQQQLECCELEFCDFIQCALVEYENREEYLKDVNHKFVITEGTDGSLVDDDRAQPIMSKGMLLQFLPKVYEPKFDGDKHHYKGFYIYPPRLTMTEHQYNNWILEKISTWKDEYPDIAETYYFDKVLYWKINNAHTVTIPRDKEWFANIFPVLQETWSKVCYYREHMDELPNVQEIADKRKAFWRYKTEFEVNNFEPGSLFLENASNDGKKTVSKYKSKATNNGTWKKKSDYKAPSNKSTKTTESNCDFIDD
jgi:hypothetical protein